MTDIEALTQRIEDLNEKKSSVLSKDVIMLSAWIDLKRDLEKAYDDLFAALVIKPSV